MHHSSPVRGWLRVQDAVEHGIAQVDVARRSCRSWRAARARRSGNSPARMRRNRSRFSSTPRSRNGLLLARLGQRAAGGAHLIRRLVVDIGLAGPDRDARPTRRAARNNRTRDRGAMPQSKPSQCTSRLIASIYSCSSLVGLVSSKRRWQTSAELLRDPEIEADRFGVADVQVSVRLGRKAGDDRRMAAGVEIAANDVADEIAPRLARPASTAVMSFILPPGPASIRRSKRGLCATGRLCAKSGCRSQVRCAMPPDRMKGADARVLM